MFSPMLTWRYCAVALVVIFSFLIQYRTKPIEDIIDLPRTMGQTLADKNQAYWK